MMRRWVVLTKIWRMPARNIIELREENGGYLPIWMETSLSVRHSEEVLSD